MSFAPLQHTATVAAVTSFLDAAAAAEGRLHDAESRAQALQRDLQQLQHLLVHARRCLLAVRKCHRSQSHAATARAIKEALASLESGQPNALSLF
jgi:hypothetical protein